MPELDKEDWLQKNTFQCELGRISPAQCKLNREKPELFEKHSIGSNIDQKESLRRKKIYMAAACGRCKDWERLCDELAERKPDNMSTATETKAETPGPESCICVCGAQFEAYKRGAITIRGKCLACLEKDLASGRAKGAESKKKASQPPECLPPKAEVLAPKSIVQEAERTEAPKPTDTPLCAKQTISLLFVGPEDEELLQRIKEIAKRERRTANDQILHWIESHVPELRKAEAR